MRSRILLADDHRIVAEGMRSLLEPEFELIGIVEDGRALLAAAEKFRPDVIIADISMPLLNGIEAVRQIKKTDKGVKVIFLTMHPDVTYAVSAMEAGALGYVLKHSAPSELTAAVRQVLRGKTYITPLLEGEVMLSPKKGSIERREESSHLTKRQREVLQLLAEGYLGKEIASMLNISTRTVEYHKYKMMKDVGIKTVADLIRYAVKHNIVSE
ncbi:MAG: response regulator transcription factor [Desulfobulbaceae bacterium]|jgi:DNA-binding NarL/FixJ family response regulator|nr:response regulator transcription factor [Desulfobulbaceae bacterium]MDH3781095.1 response regulator transcription factor [Desulfobulbaceae bacterium]MDH3921855.1 response regulator transcription factor [Desulfobulbaceae bacterium]PLX52488.1 MAG: DNA-binding response regulator [Desulfobulbaceae bacterium]HKJ13288.1 response regulator transcription factor [Desulfobulbales bacterium]